MNPELEIYYDAQVNCIYRVKNLCKINRFRTVQHSDITSQYHDAKAAFKEDKKFPNYLDSATWPVGMDTLRRNMI